MSAIPNLKYWVIGRPLPVTTSPGIIGIVVTYRRKKHEEAA